MPKTAYTRKTYWRKEKPKFSQQNEANTESTLLKRKRVAHCLSLLVEPWKEDFEERRIPNRKILGWIRWGNFPDIKAFSRSTDFDMFGIQGKNIVDDEDDGMNFTLERMSEVARNFMLFENRKGTQK